MRSERASGTSGQDVVQLVQKLAIRRPRPHFPTRVAPRVPTPSDPPLNTAGTNGGSIMRRQRIWATFVLATGLVALPGCARENEAAEVGNDPIVKGGTDVNGEYVGVANWWRAHPDSATGYTFGQV